MGDLAERELRTVIEDARARHAAVAALIYHTDVQAISLLRIYLTIGVALAGAAAFYTTTNLPIALAAEAAIFPVALGAWFCIRAMESGAINLPGRNPDFWLWAMEANRDDVLRSYLTNLQERAVKNASLNEKTARALKHAKECAVGALVMAAFAGAVALKLQP